MKNACLLVTLALALSASAGPPPPRQIFPDDYTPHPCARMLCESNQRFQFQQLVSDFRGVDLPAEWLDKHWDEIVSSFQPICAKAASCYVTAGNSIIFCNDLLADEFLSSCSRFDRDSEDWRICQAFVRVWENGREGRTNQRAKEQLAECSAGNSVATRRLDVWVVPATIGPDYKGTFTVHAIDADTRVPVMAFVTADGNQKLKQKDSPGGRPVTSLPIAWPLPLVRVPTGKGRSDLTVPKLRLTAEGYEAVTLSVPYEIPKMIVEMNPPARKLKPGANSVTITARDAATGQPVEARVMIGDRVAGETNRSFVLELAQGKKPSGIWVTSLFDRYSDVVVVP